MALIGFALAVAYVMLFFVVPWVKRLARDFGVRVSGALNTPVPHTPAPVQVSQVPDATPDPGSQESVSVSVAPEAPRGYSPYDGFKSFARGGAVSIEDIVKGLSRESVARRVSPKMPMPNVEPIFENIEPIVESASAVDLPAAAPTEVRGFAAALIEGDRAAVFAGLRQHVRGGGTPERLISSVACLVDDAYRARIDDSQCDESIARLVARIDTPTLEKLVIALTTAIDASYSDQVAGAKLALARALAVLGA